MRLVLSTRNAHKAREFAELLPGHEVAPLPGDVELPPETATRIRSSGVNILNALMARATCSWTKVVKQALQKAALCRGNPITARVLVGHLVQFMVEQC